MGITLDKSAARERFAEALAVARGADDLPEDWLERTDRVGRAFSRTYTPVLGTALLAKATDSRVDAFSLQAGASHRSYSARGLAKDVLVQLCVRSGIDLRTKNREPLNNQPFFGQSRVTPHLKVHARSRGDLEYLCSCLERADFLDRDGALAALAAFLRVRLAASTGGPVLELTASVALPALLDITSSFIIANTEGGRRGQAFVAAALDLVFEDVRTRRVNDPSRKMAGDVQVLDAAGIVMAIEVKQRQVSEEEVLQFADRLAVDEIARGGVCIFTGELCGLSPRHMWEMAHAGPGVDLFVIDDASEFLLQAFRWSQLELNAALDRFAQRMLARLEALESTERGRSQWIQLVSLPDGPR